MKKDKITIIGGGLAGLTAAIHLSQKGQKVTLFEKDHFPRHKVCGEYLSLEVKSYFDALSIPIESLKPKKIYFLNYSTAAGSSLQVKLPLGAYGISRYALDNLLYETAVKNGVEVIFDKVLKIGFLEDNFSISTSKNEYLSKYVLGSFGKRSLLDKKLERDFIQKDAPWVAVKNHYKLKDFPDNLVGLHNFKGGYCGISRIENDHINMCYLATYDSFKKFKDPEKFYQNVLRKNPFLESFLSKATPVFERPLSIAQISFESKNAVSDHVLMLGDAAGLIHPLCGNGMAIAIHSAKIASEELLDHINSGSSRKALEIAYAERWEETFKERFRTAGWLQKILLRPRLAGITQQLISKVPFLLPGIIKKTHGHSII